MHCRPKQIEGAGRRTTRVAPGARRGFALLLSLAMLALFSAVGITYVGLTRCDAVASAGHVDAARARMAALSGLEAAFVKVRADAGGGSYSDPAASWVYGGGPIDSTLTPSYLAGTAYGYAYSGTVGGTHADLGDQYVLKITDSNSRLEIKANGLPDPVMARMLDNLGRAIADDLGLNGGSAFDPILGRGLAVVAMRQNANQTQVWETMEQNLGKANWDALKDYVAFDGWVDPHTIAPTGRTSPDGNPIVTLEPRPPINVNLAPRAVIVAALADVEGPRGGPVTFNLASEIADGIVARRSSKVAGQGAFRDWKDFYRFILNFRRPSGQLLNPNLAWAILVNADPNFHPSYLNMENGLGAPFDKAALRFRTTEFTFRASGVFGITSLGRIVGADGRVVATACVETVYRLFDVLYHTVQAEFDSHHPSAQSENAASWPNPNAAAGGVPANWAGHVQLQTEVPALDPQAPAPVFSALLRNGLNADTAQGSGTASGTVEAGPDVQRDGDLLPEGVIFGPRRGEILAYDSTSNAPPAEGALEFWVKFDDLQTASLVTLVEITSPDTSEVGLQHRIRGRINNGTLTVDSQRLFYVGTSVGPSTVRSAWPVPYQFEETTWTCTLPGYGQPHEWHHVAVSWMDGTRQKLYVDGQLGSETSATLTSPTALFDGWLPYLPLIVLGDTVNLGGNQTPCAATLDDLRIYDSSSALTPALLARPRFEDKNAPLFAGRFRGGFDPLGSTVMLLGVSWTEWDPDSYNGVPYAQAPGSIDLFLDAGGGPAQVANGTGKDGLAQAGIGALPGGQSLGYLITFRHNPSVTPLNATPILDDLVVVYACNPPEVISFTWLLEE